MNVDLLLEPFSRYGSYLAIGWEEEGDRFGPPLGTGWYIRSHHARAVIRRELFRVNGLIDGAEIDLLADADSSELRFRPVDAGDDHAPAAATHDDLAPSVKVCFDDDGNLRLRGDGLGLRLHVPTGEGVVSYSEAPDLVTLNARVATRRYQLEALSGTVTLTTSWEGVSAGSTTIDLLPDAHGEWECAIDEFWSTWVRPDSRRAYWEEQASSRQDYHQFLDQLGTRPEDPDLATAWDRAAYVCWSAVTHPDGQLHRPAMFMSKNWMDQVWSWDQCFNAQALARGNQSLAWDQWFLVFDHQDEFGAIPDGLNDGFKHYNFCKPPVHGWTLRELLKRSPERPSRETLESAFGHLARHTTWFLRHRRRVGDRLPYYLHGNDSGWDNATMFDEGVPLVAPDLAALLVAQCDALADVASDLGIHADDQHGDAAFWKGEADELFAGLMDLWDGERFVPQRIKPGAGTVPVRTRSLIPSIPIFLGARLPGEVRAALVESIRGLVTDHGVATEPPDSEYYEPDGYWRGPIWAPSTYLVVEGLRASGANDPADEIASRFSRTCARSGFAENFDALTGEGLRDRAYTWTASVFLLLQGA